MKKKCKQCKQYFDKLAGIQLPAGFFCSIDHATSFAHDKAKKAQERARKKKKTEARVQKREYYRNDKPTMRKRAQQAFNKMRVLEEKLWFIERGIEPYCISCGKTNMDWCCGHYKTVGAHPEFRYDKTNTYLQCNFRCNMNLSGNIGGNKHSWGYTEGLRRRFGEAEAKRILEYLNADKQNEYEAIESLQALLTECNAKIRELEKRVIK